MKIAIDDSFRPQVGQHCTAIGEQFARKIHARFNLQYWMFKRYRRIWRP